MKLMHVTIQTNNFTDEVHFYEKIVGLTIKNEMHINGRDIVFLTSGEGEASIEIIKNEQASCAGNEHLSLGFFTGNAEKKRNELLAQKYQVSEMVSPNPNINFFFVKDPAGVTIQFM